MRWDLQMSFAVFALRHVLHHATCIHQEAVTSLLGRSGISSYSVICRTQLQCSTVMKWFLIESNCTVTVCRCTIRMLLAESPLIQSEPVACLKTKTMSSLGSTCSNMMQVWKKEFWTFRITINEPIVHKCFRSSNLNCNNKRKCCYFFSCV